MKRIEIFLDRYQEACPLVARCESCVVGVQDISDGVGMQVNGILRGTLEDGDGLEVPDFEVTPDSIRRAILESMLDGFETTADGYAELARDVRSQSIEDVDPALVWALAPSREAYEAGKAEALDEWDGEVAGYREMARRARALLHEAG